MVEEWKDISGYEGYYQVSNLGNVKSLDRTILQNNGVTINPKGKQLKQHLNHKGYPEVNLTRGGKAKGFRIHRLVAIAFIPNTDNKPEVNHINCIKTDNSVDNLEWVTGVENIRHAFQNGLIDRTKMDIKTKLEVEKYCLSGELIETYESVAEAARKNNICHASVSYCCHGKRFRRGKFVNVNSVKGFKYKFKKSVTLNENNEVISVEW